MSLKNVAAIECDNCHLIESISPEHGLNEIIREGWRDIVMTRFAMSDDQSQRENLCPGCMEAVRKVLANAKETISFQRAGASASLLAANHNLALENARLRGRTEAIETTLEVVRVLRARLESLERSVKNLEDPPATHAQPY